MRYLNKIEASYQLKKILPAHPLFHATNAAAVKILAHGEGLRSGQGSRYGSGNYKSISMTRDLSLLLDRRFGHTILVFDRDELKTKFKIVPYQYRGGHGHWDDEKEERVITEHIPSSYIKAMIMLIKPSKDRKGEVEYLDWPQTAKYIYLNTATKEIEVYN